MSDGPSARSAPRLTTTLALVSALGCGLAQTVRADTPGPAAGAGGQSTAAGEAKDVATTDGVGEVRWNPAWPRFRTWQYGSLGVLVAGQLYMEFGPGTNTGAPRVKGLAPLDDAVHDFVLLDSLEAQSDVDLASDFTWYGTLLFPLYADAVLAAWIGHDAGDVAWQLALISTQVALSVSILTRLSHLLVQRQRPLFYYAEREGRERPTVHTAESLSFISGHAALAFAGAGMTCRFHQHLPLFGADWADTTACVGTLITATATGVFRMMSDRHFFSDTVAAAAIGLAAGYYLPALLHFEAGDDAEGLRVTPWASHDDAGLALLGAW